MGILHRANMKECVSGAVLAGPLLSRSIFLAGNLFAMPLNKSTV